MGGKERLTSDEVSLEAIVMTPLVYGDTEADGEYNED